MKRRSALLAALVLAGVAVWILVPRPPGREVAPEPKRAAVDAAAGAETGAAVEAEKAETTAEEHRLELYGTVFDETDGRPIAGASVGYEGLLATAPPTRTDSRGLYRIAPPEGLGWESRLRVSADGYRSLRVELRRPRVGPTGSVPPAYLEPVLGRRPGRVVDVDGRPIAGATVRVGDEEPPFVSDEAGRFGPVPVGRKDIPWSAFAEEHSANHGEWELDGADATGELRVVLAPAAFARGLVVDEAGRPLAGAIVYEYRDPSRRRLRTDETGRFRWPMAPGEQALLVALAGERRGAAPAYAGAPVRIRVEPDGSVPHPHWAPSPGPLRPRATAVFRVLDPGGHPLPGVEAVSDPGPGLETWGHDWTDADGVARVPVAAGERVEIRVRARFHTAATGEVLLEPGETGHIGPFVLRPVPPRPRPPFPPVEVAPEPEGTFLVGRVVDTEGRPVKGADVAPTGIEEEWTDLSGRFRIPAGPKGRAIGITVGVEGYAPIRAVVVAGGPETLVRLPPRGAIRVRLLGGPSPEERGEPVFTLWTDARLEDSFLDQDGPFLLDEGDSLRIDCPAGTWPLRLQAGGLESVFYPAVTVRGGEETEIEYRFPRLGRLEGRIIGPDGRPVAGAGIFVAATGDRLAETGAAGRFAFRPAPGAALAPAGTYPLRIVAPGFAPALTPPVDLTEDGGSISVRLSCGGRVRGRVEDRTGAPVPGADVDWLPATGPSPFGCRTDDDGRFEFEETFAPGNLRLRVRARGREERVLEVGVVEGEWTDAILRLPE